MKAIWWIIKALTIGGLNLINKGLFNFCSFLEKYALMMLLWLIAILSAYILGIMTFREEAVGGVWSRWQWDNPVLKMMPAEEVNVLELDVHSRACLFLKDEEARLIVKIHSMSQEATNQEVLGEMNSLGHLYDMEMRNCVFDDITMMEVGAKINNLSRNIIMFKNSIGSEAEKEDIE